MPEAWKSRMPKVPNPSPPPGEASDPPSDPAAAPHERIVAVARDLFCRDGIHATGVDRILAAAGASKMTLYARFGSKEALIRAALREEGRIWRESFAARIRAEATPEARLRAIVPTLSGWFRGGRFYGCAFMNAVAEHTKGAPWLRELAAEHQGATRAVLADLAREGGYAAPESFARQLLLLIDGTVAALMVSGDEEVLQVAARTLDMLLACGERVPAQERNSA